MPGECSPALFQGSTLPLSPRASARAASITSLRTSKRVRFLKKVWSHRPSNSHEFLLRAKAFTRQPLTMSCLTPGGKMTSPTRKLSPDIRKNESTFPFVVTSFMLRFPRTAPSIGEWSSSMVLVAFLGSRLGSQDRNLLRHNQMPRAVGEGKSRKRAGTTPPLAAARRRTRWSFPPFARREWSTARSKPDQFGISN